MTTTISVSDVTKSKFDSLRPEGAASADEFLAALLDYYEEGVEPDYGDDLPADVREQLDRIESATTTAETRTGRIERALEQEGIGE